MEKDKEPSLQTLKSYLPLIYIFLVCFGYFNKSMFYYDIFDLDILYYMGIQELVLMFIPLGSILIAIIIFLLAIVFPMAIFIPESGNDKSENTENKEYSGKKKSIKVLDYAFETISYAVIAYLIFLFPLFILAYSLFREGTKNFFDSGSAFILMFLWGILFLVKLVLMPEKDKKKIHHTRAIWSVVAIMAFILYSYSNYLKANRILKGETDFNVKFTINNKQIQTTDELLFFGQTTDYIFIRNICTNENLIYNKNDIEELIMEKKEQTNSEE